MLETSLHNEHELLQQISEGHEPSFRLFFDHYRESIFDFLAPMTKSKEVAEELVMDIFLKLWLGREWICEIRNMEAFLQKVAYNKAIDFLRLTARNKKLKMMIAKEMEDALDHSLEAQLAERDYRSIIQEACADFPNAACVYAQPGERTSHDEIARELNLSIHTVSNHSKEALKFIRGFLRKTTFWRCDPLVHP